MLLIAKRGYQGLSLRDVGRLVGISHPAVIYHFPSKEALLLAVIKRYEDMFGLVNISIGKDPQTIVEGGIRPPSIEEMGIALMRLAKLPMADTIVTLDCALTVEAADESHPAHEHFVYRNSLLTEFLSCELERLVSEGVAAFSFTSGVLANALIRGWYGMAVHALYPSGDGCELNSIPGFLASAGVSLELSPESLLRVGARVPEELADVFSRSLRIYQDMRSA